jgi:hypothetical protein
MDAFRSIWYRLVVLLMTLLVPFSWFTTGPGNLAFAIYVIGWTFVLDPVLIDHVEGFMPGSWFHVPRGERVIHRLLGVSIFSRLLELSGWNNVVVRPILKTESYRPGTRASLAVRANSARRGGGAHAICFALHVLLAAATLFAGYPRNALRVLLPGVVVHLYPTLLQRSILLRLQPLLDRAPAVTS